MGWERGQGLGRSQQGPAEPVIVTVRLGTTGLGCSTGGGAGGAAAACHRPKTKFRQAAGARAAVGAEEQ